MTFRKGEISIQADNRADLEAAARHLSGQVHRSLFEGDHEESPVQEAQPGEDHLDSGDERRLGAEGALRIEEARSRAASWSASQRDTETEAREF